MMLADPAFALGGGPIASTQTFLDRCLRPPVGSWDIDRTIQAGRTIEHHASHAKAIEARAGWGPKL